MFWTQQNGYSTRHITTSTIILQPVLQTLSKYKDHQKFFIGLLYMCLSIVCVCVWAWDKLSELSLQINRELTGTERDRQQVNILTQINSVSALCLSAFVSCPQEVMWMNNTDAANNIWFNGIILYLQTQTQVPRGLHCDLMSYRHRDTQINTVLTCALVNARVEMAPWLYFLIWFQYQMVQMYYKCSVFVSMPVF